MLKYINYIKTSPVPHLADRSLPDEITKGEAVWRRWYDSNEPENEPIPDYDLKISEAGQTGPWMKLLLVRSLRMDRTVLAVQEFVRKTAQMGPRYVEPVTDTIQSIYEGMDSHTPVIYLLSVGADPTDAIETLCRKKKQQAGCAKQKQKPQQKQQKTWYKSTDVN